MFVRLLAHLARLNIATFVTEPCRGVTNPPQAHMRRRLLPFPLLEPTGLRDTGALIDDVKAVVVTEPETNGGLGYDDLPARLRNWQG